MILWTVSLVQNETVACNLHSIDQWSIALEAVCCSLSDLIQEAVERHAKYENLQNLGIC
jgi:hypothetical protein